MQDIDSLQGSSSPPTLQTVSARAEFEKKAEDEKSKLRHYKKMVKLGLAEEKAAVLRKAIELNRQRLLEQAEGAVAMRKNLDDGMIAQRVVVFETLAGVGIPLSKLDDPAFLSLVEGDCPRQLWLDLSLIAKRFNMFASACLGSIAALMVSS